MVKQKMDEWCSRQELIENCDIKPSEADKEISKLILSGFIEADYSNPRNPKFKIAEYQDGSHYKKINKFLESITIRHGYDHLKHKYVLEGKKANIKDCEIFEIPPKLVWILQKTKNEIFQREIPFDNFVLDCDLKTEKIWFKGITIKVAMVKGKRQIILFAFYGKDEYCNENFFTMLFDANDKPLIRENNDYTIWKEVKIPKSSLNELKMFVCNFLDFLNQPEVRIIRFERTKKNTERRIKQGKEVLPSVLKIKIDGKLRVYYDNLNDFGNLKDKYVVRGHYMRFWNKKKYGVLYNLLEKGNLPQKYHVDKKMRGYQDIIAIWKKPFIKGHGLLIRKKYKLEKTNLRRK